MASIACSTKVLRAARLRARTSRTFSSERTWQCSGLASSGPRRSIASRVTELSQPVAVLLHEEALIVAVASQAGYRCFTAVADFKAYVRAEVLAEAGSP